MGLQTVPIRNIAVAYDDPDTGMTMILVFNQVLHFDDLDHNLICPNQLRMNGIEVRECPPSLDPDQNKDSHTIKITTTDFIIPLQTKGIMSLFYTRKPTKQELEDCEWLMMTSDSIEWKPEEDINVHIECNISSVQVRNRGTVSPETLASRWGISLDRAKRTTQVTTQRCVRDFTHVSLARRLKPTSYQLRFKHLRTTFYTDTMWGPGGIGQKVTSKPDNNIAAQIFVDSTGFTAVYPIHKRSEAADALATFLRHVGVPAELWVDGAGELKSGKFADMARKAGAKVMIVEPYTPKLNLAELGVREIKRMAKSQSRRNRSPKVLWDHCYQLMGEIRSHIATNRVDLNFETPKCIVTGDTGDISHLCEFEWYELCWFWSPVGYEYDQRKLGRWLGPSHDVGEALCAKILTDKGKIVHRTSYIKLSNEDYRNQDVKKRIEELDTAITEKLGNYSNVDDDDVEMPIHEPTNLPTFDPIDEQAAVNDVDDYDDDVYDNLISAQVLLPKGDEMALATVVGRKRDTEGNLIGKNNVNPFLNTAVYDVSFADGHTQEYAANIITEHIHAQLSDEGNLVTIIKNIVDHRADKDAIKLEDQEYLLNGRLVKKRTTKGWHLQVEWQDGTTSWERLADLKETAPFKVAEYAKANGIDKEPAFNWWINVYLKKQKRSIRKVKSQLARKSHKFGIQVPKNVEEAFAFDKSNGNDLWKQAIMREMKNVRPAFKVLDENEAVPPTHQFVRCHMIFDVKMDFTRKARLVAGGHMTETPTAITYASVVSRESVRIALLIAALNNLNVMCADVQNAYLNAPCNEKIWTTCGPEFGTDAGKKALIVRALYGLKSSAAAWRTHLCETLHLLGWTPTKGDPDVWMRPATKSDGDKIYEYLLVYVDDLLAVGLDCNKILSDIDSYFKLKPNSIAEPTMYLGSNVSKYKFPGDTKEYWSMGSEKYVNESINNVKQWLGARGLTLKKRTHSPFPTDYRPELDVTEPLNDEETHYFMSQISVLRWIVELGRIDIATEVSMLSSYMASPRKGHLMAIMHLFGYLMAHSRSRMVFDSGYQTLASPAIDVSMWAEFYGNVKEPIPCDVPEPRGNVVQMIAFVDADHAGDLLTRRSRTGVIIFLNSAPVSWISKKQSTIETSSFGSEFAALKVGTEMIVALRYKLRTMGIPIDGPCHVRCDNQSVVTNASVPTSTLKKKHNSIAFHYVREKVADGTIAIFKEDGKTNIADMFSKVQGGTERRCLAQRVLY